MGFMNYFKIAPQPATKPIENEKTLDPEALPELQPPMFAPSSRPTSSRSTSSRQVDDIKHQVMLNRIFQQQRSLRWIPDRIEETENEGVILRKERNNYLFNPPSLATSALAHAMKMLNVQAAMTVSSEVIQPFIDWSPEALDVPLLDGLRIQVLPTLEDLCRARKHQYAAFIASEKYLVVWDDDPLHILVRAKQIEAELVRYAWDTTEAVDSDGDAPLKDTGSQFDEESGQPGKQDRPIMYYNAFLVACSLCLITTMLGLGYQSIAEEVMLLRKWTSVLLVLMTPITIFFALFTANVVVAIFAQIIGPIQQLTKNSRFYSAVASPRLTNQVLPHITIQCPVYKEGLSAVIEPTVKSLKVAISTYELQGGSANILINDDGLQFIPEEERQARIDFYADNSIGWTARPKHGKDGFVRKGKFKKASNMNYGLALSLNVEEKLQKIDRPADWTHSEEVIAYERCLLEVLEADGKAWADGDIRIGDYILIIDSDTRVPTDCLLDAASEMEQSPQVAIIQFSSGVMQVAHNFFENGITFFTNMIYTAIRFGVSSGDVAPFVGHNAILRWSAIQRVAFIDEDDGKEKFWSESHVSEDFDMALRLQVLGYIVRLAGWAGDGFKEGVSLTVYDELTRWEKYAYGCNELVFNPIRTWLWRGPFTPLFRRFLASGMPLGSKFNIVAYIGTYYAIGASWILTLANYIAVGLYNGYLDKWYLESWKIWICIVAIFCVCGNVALAVQRHRTGTISFIASFIENFKWAFMFIIFFGGISLHVSQALLCHMFEIDMSWGATSKEVEFSNFFIEVPKVLKNFKYSISASLLMVAGMVVMATATFIPWSWNINQFVAIFPMATICASHLLLPIALNPDLMTFSW